MIAASAATNRAAFDSSGPGIGSNKTSGKRQAAASLRVRPPGFVTKIDEICINAATYATNTIPRSELDRSSINRDMDVNIKR